MGSISKQDDIKTLEIEGLKEMRCLSDEYFDKGEGSKPVRDYLLKACEDEVVLIRYLKGRKFRPKHAWDTLRRNAEIRFETYPEIFPSSLPKNAMWLIENYAIGFLKARDSKGRRIGFFNGSLWDPEKYSMELLTIVATYYAELMLKDKDAMDNGVVFIQQCSGMGMKHAKLYTIPSMLRLINVFWYSYPLKLKGVYYINVPVLLTFLYGIIKPFFPNKLKERFLMTSTTKKFEALHEKLSPDILPKCLGGNLEYHEAVDTELTAAIW
ncbi:Alpha-tocopherol transfer protein [Orchesella cincta]|uniref:Alpha-tocopherol transfer protein n=1 Tax=Orchesella cincta TaxID=48709 RepID=A0A1D2M7K6_ORCCI|nr:Alpha-tocopherol transfer protein [Orchesella cincta]